MNIESVLEIQRGIDRLFDLREPVVPNRITVKLGGEVVVGEDGLFNTPTMSRLAMCCSDLMNRQQHGFHIVTSGAFALGSAEMKREDSNFDPKNCSIETRQVITSRGQIELYRRWDEVFLVHGIKVVQFLISDHDWTGKDRDDTRRRIENLRRPLLHALSMRWIPFDNGNDGTNDTGMRELLTSRDNDLLAVIRALMAYAKHLIFGTNAPGVLDRNMKVIPAITSLDDLERVYDHGSLTGRGITTGGMLSKVGASVAFGRQGRESFIVNGSDIYNIGSILAGEIGTRIAIAA